MSDRSPELVQKQGELDSLMDRLHQLRYEIEKRIELTQDVENQIQFVHSEAASMKEICDRRLKEAMPILQHSIEGLSKINRVELDEIKSFNRPADTIVNLMTAVCIILRIEPLICKDK